MKQFFDVVIVGGGQSALALAYYLRRSQLSYVILDAEEKPGGSWQNYWDSVTLFSPAQWSSLPGTLMPGGTDQYPAKQDVLSYFKSYEEKYKLNIQRPVWVESVQKREELFTVTTSKGIYTSRVVVGATGSFRNPFIPDIAGLDVFKGELLHSSAYRNTDEFAGKRIAIIGEGNSGAQILAELSNVATTFWITKDQPDYLPDEVDGKYLFDAATQLFEAKKLGRSYIPPSLGHIVMVPSVKDARERKVLNAFTGLQEIKESTILLEAGQEIAVDAIIFCTGFKPSLAFLEQLPVTVKFDKIHTSDTRSRELPGLWMIGYGSWTGFASATVVGVGRSAKQAALEIVEFLKHQD